jgi:hypothetical protein
VEKKQYELCLEILRRFNKAGILKDFILIVTVQLSEVRFVKNR